MSRRSIGRGRLVPSLDDVADESADLVQVDVVEELEGAEVDGEPEVAVEARPAPVAKKKAHTLAVKLEAEMVGQLDAASIYLEATDAHWDWTKRRIVEEAILAAMKRSDRKYGKAPTRTRGLRPGRRAGSLKHDTRERVMIRTEIRSSTHERLTDVVVYLRVTHRLPVTKTEFVSDAVQHMLKVLRRKYSLERFPVYR